MANWWDSAPLAQQQAAPQGNWWEAAPLAQPEAPEAEGPSWWDRTTEAWGNRLASDWQGLDNFVRMLANGATFGGADEIAAGAQAGVDTGLGFFGDIGAAYDENLAAERARDAEIRTADPVGSAITEGIGAVGGGLAAASLPAIGRLFGLGGSSLLGRMAAGAGLGAAGGATGGFLSGEGGFGPRMQGALTGGALGGVIGTALPVASRAGGLLLERALGPNPAAQAERLLADRLAADRMTMTEVGQRMERLGPEAMLVDAGGPNTLRLGGTVYRAPGPGAETAQSMLEARRVGQQGRIVGAAEDALGARGDNIYGSIEDLIRQRQTAAAPLYREAFETAPAIDIEPLIARIDDRLGTAKGAIASALSRARALMTDADGNPETTLASLHEVKLALDDMIESATRDSSMGRTARRELIGVRDDLLSIIDEAVPIYAEARAAFAGPSASIEAIERGRSFIREDAEVTAAELANLSDADRYFFLSGAMRAIRDRIGGRSDGRNAVDAIFGNQSMRDKLRALFESDDAFEAFRRQMEAEARFWEVDRAVRAGSQTAERLASDQAAGLTPGMSAALDIGLGNVPGTTQVARTFLDFLLSGSPRMSPQAYDELARMMFSRAPEVNAETLEALQQRGLLDVIAPQLAGGARAGLAGMLGHNAPPPVAGGLLSLIGQ